MKNILKSRIFIAFAAVLFVGTISVFADDILEATGIRYKNKTVESSLNELYIKANAKDVGALKFCKFIDGTYGSFGQIGSKYECEVGDSIKYNFYLLTINNDNSVDLIMDRNITQGSSATTMTWNNAMKYIGNNNLKTTWSNVLDVDLPKAQDIAKAVGNTGWNMEDKNYDGWFYFDPSNGTYGQTQVANASSLSNYRWLYNYTKECSTYGCDAATSLGAGEASGYWTRDIVAQQKDSTGRAWLVNGRGSLNSDPVSRNAYRGVRPVITVLKSNLYSE